MHGENCCGGRGRGEGCGSGRAAHANREWSSGAGGHGGWGHGADPGWSYGGPTKAERKEWLESFKKHLEERLSDVSGELSSL